MKFERKLIEGILIKRYKRFLADIRLTDGKPLTVHCPNSGSMKTCKEPGWKVMISDSYNPKRKLRYTWEMIHNGNCWIGINTHLPNHLAEEGIHNGVIKELQGYEHIQREVKYGKNSRIDLLLTKSSQKCYVEVKNVTLVEDGYYQFPDAVTERGRKHLYEMTEMVRQGHRAVMLYVIQRSDGKRFKPANHIDPNYASTLKEALQNGIVIIAYRADVSPEKINIKETVEVDI